MQATRLRRSSSRRGVALVGAVVLALATSTIAQAGPAPVNDVIDPPLTYPNLKPDVQHVHTAIPLTFDPDTGTLFEGPPTMYFDSWARNEGDVPLQLTAEEVESAESYIVAQCVSWTSRVCREQVIVGRSTWHEEHTHFHFAEFATYELRRLTSAGRPDYSTGGLVAVSEKVSFCFVDWTATRDDAPPQFYVTCSPAMQGVSPGWADVYESGLPGQELPLTGLTDGRYALVVKLDPRNLLYETNDGDNVVEITVEFSNNLTQAAIVGRNYPPPAPTCPKKKCKPPRQRA